MIVTQLTSDRREEWDSFAAASPVFAMMQSWEWGEFKESLGWCAFRVAVEEGGRILAGAQMLIKHLPGKLFSIAYIPRGPLGDWLQPPVAFLLLPELHRIARQQRAIFLKIEPPLPDDSQTDGLLRGHGFNSSPFINQPRATIIMDLAPQPEELLSQMRKKTRSYIRAAAEKGVTVRLGTDADLPDFYAMMRTTARREEFSPRSYDYYAQEYQTFARLNQAALLMAYYQERLLVVRMIYRFGSHTAAFHSGSNGEFSELHPNTLLVWEAIKWARSQGSLTYDLWGIPEEVGQAVSAGLEPPVSERTDGLWGVYRFKSGFSKNVVYYMGAYDYVYNPLMYRLVTNRFINAETLERISARLDSFSPGSKRD